MGQCSQTKLLTLDEARKEISSLKRRVCYLESQAAAILPEYADNAAALLAGAEEGSYYRTGDTVKVVHA